MQNPRRKKMKNQVKEIKIQCAAQNGAQLPEYKTIGAAGADVYAYLTENITLEPGEYKMIPTGLSCSIPEGFEIQVRPRSGLAAKNGVTVLNAPGTIDSDYRDPVGVILQNTYNIANLPYQIARDPRILEDLCDHYREMDLEEYLAEHGGTCPAGAALLNITGQKIYVDDDGNPYGTIYIKQGERIAQMIFCEYKRANFIPHPNPNEIGKDRGGGFGHTGRA